MMNTSGSERKLSTKIDSKRDLVSPNPYQTHTQENFNDNSSTRDRISAVISSKSIKRARSSIGSRNHSTTSSDRGRKLYQGIGAMSAREFVTENMKRSRRQSHLDYHPTDRALNISIV